MNISIPGTSGNRRRNYGVEFAVNGKLVVNETIAAAGDTVTGRYIGGNLAQYPEQRAAIAALEAIGKFRNGDRTYGPITIP